MPRLTTTLEEKKRAPYTKSTGVPRPRHKRDGQDNDFIQTAEKADGSDTILLNGTDALNNRLIGGAVDNAFTTSLRFAIHTTAKITTAPFFVNCNDTTPLEIVSIQCLYDVTNGAALTAYVSKDGAGQAPGAGTSAMTGTFNLNTTARTLQTATLAGARGYPGMVLNPGEQLSLKLSTTTTSLAGLIIAVGVRPHTGVSIAQYYRSANGDIATGTIYLNVVPGTSVRAVAVRWGTAGTDAGAVTCDVTKDTSTNAPGAGTSVLGAAQSVKGTANVAVYPALASLTTRTMAVGDRLAIKMTGTLTALANLCVSVFFNAGPDSHIVIPLTSWDAQATDRTVYVADTYIRVTDYWGTWSTASSSNKKLLTKDTGTQAAGAGTGLLTDNSAAGIDTSTTANTPVGSLPLTAVSTMPTLWLAPGDRLGIKNAGTTGSLAGFSDAIVLRKV